MKQVLRVLCAFLLLGSTSVLAMSSFRILIKPNGRNCVLILGDVHDSDDLIPNTKTFVQIIESAQFKKPLPITIECDRSNLPEDGRIVDSILLLVNKWDKKNSKVLLDCYDPRGVYSSVLEMVRRYLGCVVGGCVPQKELNDYPQVPEWTSTHYEALKEQKKDYETIVREQVQEGAEFTVGGFLEFLEDNSEKLKALAEKYQQRSDVYFKINSMYEKYVEATNKIKEALATRNLENPLHNELISFCFESETIDDLLRFYDTFYKLYCVDTDYIFYEACLFDRVLSCEADDTPQCYIVGEVHAEKLSEALCCVKGWKKNVSESFYCMSNSFTTVVTVGPSFGSYLRKLIPIVVERLLVSCQVCNKVGDIKKCGGCKELLYCSVQCQKKVWKEHEKVCKKVKVKI